MPELMRILVGEEELDGMVHSECFTLAITELVRILVDKEELDWFTVSTLLWHNRSM